VNDDLNEELKKNPSLRYFVHRKSRKKSPGIEPKAPR
jgi:hypothetical protein